MITVGTIVKFIDSGGQKNAGTVVDIQKANGQKRVLLNTIEGKSILMDINKVYEVKNSVRGKRVETRLREVAEELGKEFVPVKEKASPLVPTPVTPSSTTEAEGSVLKKEITSYRAKISEMTQKIEAQDILLSKADEHIKMKGKEIEELQKQLSYKDMEIQSLQKTISYLSESIQCLIQVDHPKATLELINCIKALNNIEVTPKQ